MQKSGRMREKKDLHCHKPRPLDIIKEWILKRSIGNENEKLIESLINFSILFFQDDLLQDEKLYMIK